MPARAHTADDALPGVVRRSVLPGGLRVITEQIPGVRSATFGIFVGVGSRHENRRQSGASHYLEHLLFKGTPRRNALEISASIDRVGGELNAYTTKEYTCYYARVLDEDLPLAIDVLTDMVVASRLAPVDVDAERGVILEEIAMHDDEPADIVHDEFSGAVFGNAPLGRPILGSVASIQALSRTTIAGYWRRGYTPERMVIAAAGNLSHRRVIQQLRAALGPWLDAYAGGTEVPASKGDFPVASSAEPAERVRVLRRRGEQVNLIVGTRGLPRADERRWTMAVLGAALGGGMSSLLFQEIREKRGLAYSVYSFTSGYHGDGLFGVYAGCQPKRARQVVDLCREQFAAVAQAGLSAPDLALGKGQVRGGIVLGLEDTGARMTRLGKGELVYDRVMPIAEMLAAVAAVTPGDVQDLAAELLTRPMSLVAVGPIDDRDARKWVA